MSEAVNEISLQLWQFLGSRFRCFRSYIYIVDQLCHENCMKVKRQFYRTLLP